MRFTWQKSQTLLAAVLMLLAGSGERLAAGEGSLQWGRSAVHRQPEVIFDQQVMAAAWEEDDAQVVREQVDGNRRSILVRPSVDPAWESKFVSDDSARELLEEPRIAQLPEEFADPFDEPDTDYLPESEEDLEAVESAIEEEQESHEGAGEDASEMDTETADTDAGDLEDSDLFGDQEPAEESSDEVEMPTPDVAKPELEPALQTPDWKELDMLVEIEIEGMEELEAADDAKFREQLKEERLRSEVVCREEAAKIKSAGIDTIDLNIRVSGNAGEDFPFTCSIDPLAQEVVSRDWPQVTYHWKASGLCHKPLYFEQVQLERYGHSWGPYVQPIMSGAHFFGTLPVLPYKMGLKTPGECVYTLGYYRPGSCAPKMLGGVPFSWRAVLFQGGVVTGISAIVP